MALHLDEHRLIVAVASINSGLPETNSKFTSENKWLEDEDSF